MVLLFVDSKHEYFKELIGERCFFNFDKKIYIFVDEKGMRK